MNDTSFWADTRLRQVTSRVAKHLAQAASFGWRRAKSAIAYARASIQSKDRRSRSKPRRNVNDDRASGVWARTPIETRGHPEGIDTLIFVGSRPVLDVELEMFTACLAVDVRLDQDESLQRAIPIPQNAQTHELPELSIEPESIRLRWKLKNAENTSIARSPTRAVDSSDPPAKPLRSDSTRASTPTKRDQSEG